MESKKTKKPGGKKKRKAGPLFWMRNNFLRGVAVIVPIVLTVYIVRAVVDFIDNWVLPYLPKPILDSLPEYQFPGFGVIVFIIFSFLIGWATKGLVGNWLLSAFERLLGRIPVVSTLHRSLKQIAETVLQQSDRAFKTACLVEYPRPGLWAIAFISSPAKGEIKEKGPGGSDDLISVFLPTTPNPTSGFLLFVPRSKVIELDMDIESAAKLVISAGLVYPPKPEAKKP